MHIAQSITKIIDTLYLKPVATIIPQQLWRYGVCGVLNMVLDSVWYFLIYHFIVCKQFFDLGFVVVSPHIASLAVVFPITFLTGFWLNRNVAFRTTEVRTLPQIMRYALSVVGSIVLNYICMKFFVESLGLWATPSKMLTTVVCAVYSYLVGRYYTFRQ